MEKKKWSEYTQEEKETLLHHWLYYHGFAIVSIRDIVKFDIVTREHTDKIYEVAINGYINNMNAKVLIMALRNNNVERLFDNTIKKEELNQTQKEIYNSYENEFLEMLVDSYNNPKAPVPMSEEEIISQVRPLLTQKKLKK